MDIRRSRPEEIGEWMALTREMRRDFPGLATEEGMAAHRQTVLPYMEAGRALSCWLDGTLAGVLLYTLAPGSLDFLAVRRCFRRRHVAERLVRMALEQIGPGNVTVMTHPAGVPEGQAARAFYRRMGFEEGPVTEAFGAPVQILYLRRSAKEKDGRE